MENGIVKSAARTIRILSTFAEVKKSQRAAEISQAINIPLSSCVALLDTLVAEGVLSYEFKSRQYFPTDQVRRIGSWLDGIDFLELSAAAAARRISRLLGCNCALARVYGAQIEWVFTTGGREAPVGARLPLCGAPAGIAILSQRSPEEIAYAVGEYKDISRWHQADAAQVSQRVADAARLGYSFGKGNRDPFSHALALVLKNEDNGEEMVLSLFLPEARFVRARDHILKTVRGCLDATFQGASPVDCSLPLVA